MAFEDWLAESPRNALDYVEVERLHQMAGALRSDVGSSAAAAPLTTRSTTARRKHARHRFLALAAALVLAIGGGLWLIANFRQAPSSQYATAVGEQRHVNLPDGSWLVLDTDTLVQVTYERSWRRIALLRGRLQADVMRDGSRPFVVTSGGGSVRALGTVFQVERQSENTIVRLLQGRVVVDTRAGHTRELHPLQQLAYDQTGKLGSPQSVDSEAAESWTRGRLVFKNERLADLVSEFNRYSRDQLVLSEATLGDIRVSGAFNADDQAGLLAALRQGWGLQAKSAGKNRIELSASKQ
jgi:transmembrane sensor